MGVFERLDGEEPEGLTAANPSGVNGYDKGMSFEEATKGVERDSSGRFAPESGSHQGRFRGNYSGAKGREARRRASIERSRSVREEKKNKKSESEKKKTEAEKKKTEAAAKKVQREAERVKKAAQTQVLADYSLKISEAIAAGDTIKAAELRVGRSEKALEFADTHIERTRAQTALNNAQASLQRAKKVAARKRKASSESAGKTSTTTTTRKRRTRSPTAGGTAKVVTGPHAKGEPYEG